MNRQRTTNLIIGIGNEFRSDDGVGLYVARQLQKLKPANCTIKEASGEGTYLMSCWEGYDCVIIIDAVRFFSAPGTIYRIDTDQQDLPANWVQCSSHFVSLPEAIQLSQSLGKKPPTLIIYGIEGSCFDAGIRLSAEAKAAAESVAETIAGELKPRVARTSRRAAANRKADSAAGR